MDDNLTDAALTGQPIGHWTGVAHREIVGWIRGELATLGLSQPQYWLLRNLSPHDLAPNGEGQALPELADRIRSYLWADDDLPAAAADLVERALLTRDADERLTITKAGETARTRVKDRAPELRAHIHDGIADADYVTALKVLRRMIANVGGPTS